MAHERAGAADVLHLSVTLASLRMGIHEIKPKQLRALLLLLVLVPFIPLVLMLRFMVDALDSARTVAVERTSSVYQQALFNAQGSLEKHLVARPKPPRAEDVFGFYRDLFSG